MTERTRSVAIIGTRGYPSYYGGFETAVRHLAPYLARAGWDVTVYGRPGDGSVRPDEADPGVKVRTTAGIESTSLSTLTYGFTSCRDSARARPDVALVMNCANGFFLGRLRRAGIPIAMNVDGIEWERAKWGRIGKAVFRRGATLTARHANTIVVDAQAIGDYWHKHFDRESVVIPYGGEPSAPLPAPKGLPDRGYALMVSRLVPENSVMEFLDAAETLAEEFPVVLIGGGAPGSAIETRARSLSERDNNFSWLGHLSDDAQLHSLWQHCGVYFHGHTVGGTNPALVQAMALGAPTVAIDTVYNREVLADHGCFVQPDPAEIADALRSMIASTNEALRSSLVERAAEHYSWEAVCARYEQALYELVESKARSPR